jgi:hypothetical protein
MEELNIPGLIKMKHTGRGEFIATFEDGGIEEVGKSLRGMIRYTYFEDYTFPPVGWEITHDVFIKDYMDKIMKDIREGKIILGRSKIH